MGKYILILLQKSHILHDFTYVSFIECKIFWNIELKLECYHGDKIDFEFQ